MPKINLFKKELIINTLWFQVYWWSALLFQFQSIPFLLLLLGLHFYFFPYKHNIIFTLLFAFIGSVIDNLLFYFGIFVFSSSGDFIPIWLVFLWVGFANTLYHSLYPLIQNRYLATVSFAIAGPISYLAGAQLGAVILPYSIMTTLSILTPIWAIIGYGIFVLSTCLEKNVKLN